MPSEDDLRFGSIAVSRKYTKPEYVSECLQMQADDEAQRRPRRSLGEIMVQKGYLWPEHVKKIVEAQSRGGKQGSVGPYDLLGKLGAGGMGTVFHAKLRGTHIEVALKLLPERLVADPVLLARFKREAALGKELLHPNILRTLDCGEDRGVHYITLELLEGSDLDKRIKQEVKLPEREALAMVRDVAKGLQHAHEKGLVHRDIKPSNILFDRSGTVKLADFGLVKMNDPQAVALTQTGAVMGTPSYLAPEQAQNAKDIDIRADIYALGATLYQTVTGRTPHEGDTPYEVVLKHITETLTPPSQWNPDLSPACVRLITRMLAKDRNARHATPQEVVEAIDGILADRSSAAHGHGHMSEGPRTTTPLSKSGQEAEEKKRLAWLLIGAAGGLVVLFLLWALWSSYRQNTRAPEPPPSSAAVNGEVPQSPSDPPRAPTVQGAARWVDLLPGIELARDQVTGAWTKELGVIRTEAAVERACTALQTGLPPGEEYDYRIEFQVERDARNGFGCGEINLIFPAGGKQARMGLWCLDFHQIGFVWDRAHFRLFNVAGSNNPTLRRQSARLEQGKKYTAHVEVRTARVRGYLDGQFISEWNPDKYTENDMEAFTLPNRLKLGVGAYQSAVRFTKIEVREHRAGP